MNENDKWADLAKKQSEEVAARRRLLEELRGKGKRSSIILGGSEEDHESVEDQDAKADRVANEFDQIDRQNASEMKTGGIGLTAMDIEKEEYVEDEDTGEMHVETGEIEIDVETIDLRLDDGLKSFLRDDIKQELFGADAPQGNIDRLTQCPHCKSHDVQTLAPPNMYCNDCDKTYTYELGAEEIAEKWDLPTEKMEVEKQDDPKTADSGIIFLGEEPKDPRRIHRIKYG